MLFESAGAGAVFLLARLLFGGVLAFTGLNHFMNTDEMTQYADFKGLPAPRASVLASGGTLVFGGLSIVLGAFPAIGAGAIALFLLVAAVTMHDFWTLEGEEAQTEMTQFLKNIYGVGAALGFLVAANVSWPYAVGLGL
jgi:uncharacterized membrane protein YphA (DoxX/SURF4 family)